MIKMTVSEKNIYIAKCFVLNKLIAKRSQTCAGIEDEHMRTAAHFDARSIAPIANSFRPGTSNAPSHPPESNSH